VIDIDTYVRVCVCVCARARARVRVCTRTRARNTMIIYFYSLKSWNESYPDTNSQIVQKSQCTKRSLFKKMITRSAADFFRFKEWFEALEFSSNFSSECQTSLPKTWRILLNHRSNVIEILLE